MEPGNGFPGAGILGRLGEKILGWVALGLLVLAAYGVYRMGPEGRGAVLSAAGRTVGWIAFVALLPWISRFFVKRLLSVGENWVGLLLIGGLLVVDVLVGLWLLGGLPTGVWSWIVSLAAIGVAGAYNFLVCEYVAERYGGI